MDGAKQGQLQDRDFYAAYASFSNLLRAWLAAYGIGAPVLFVSQEHIARVVVQSGEGRMIVFVFLFGLAVQVLAALFYKSTLAYLYFGQRKVALQSTRRYRLSERIFHSHVLEFTFDVATILAYGWATMRVLVLLTGGTVAFPG